MQADPDSWPALPQSESRPDLLAARRLTERRREPEPGDMPNRASDGLDHRPDVVDVPEPWRDLSVRQQGVVGRDQLLALGMTRSQARRNVVNGRWQLLVPGVYAVFTGPVGDVATIWAALLAVGEGASASHGTALWLAGVLDQRPSLTHISIPASRRVRPPTGVRVHRTRASPGAVHPVALPPRTRVEVALLDHSDLATAGAALDVILRAIQRRITTAARIRAALTGRPRHRWRALLGEVLQDAGDGVQSPLERRFLRDVERAHHLPRAMRNRAESAITGQRLYRDVRYRRWSTVVELDGREAHPVDSAFRDHRRDNAAAIAGDVALRYGWRDVVDNPCVVAAEVAAVLRLGGWTKDAVSCGPHCALPLAA